MNKILVHLEEQNLKLVKYIKKEEYKLEEISKTSFYVYGSPERLERIENILLEKYNISTIIKNNEENLNKFKKSTTSYKIKSKDKTLKKKGIPSPYFYSNQMSKIYGLTAKNSLRVNIGIIELGGGYYSSDLQNYWRTIGLTNFPIVNTISIDGATNNPLDIDSSIEVALDIQIVGGICPKSTINVYFAPNSDQGFYHAIARAINDKCSTISISWAGPEMYWSPSILTTYDNLFKVAVSKGITICVASGDTSSNNGTNTNVVYFPGSSPNVLCCGGTKLICPNLSYDNSTIETTWYDSKTEGSSGGYSSVFLTPTYQLNNVPNYNNIYRGIPDVSGNAEPSTGWIIIYRNTKYAVGGTSAVAPMWAGYLAAINCKTFANNIIYRLKGIGFHDITTGNNEGFNASSGWDPCTGLGSPNGKILSNYFV
uniref:Peptidase S53 domain-containing protein n=1 Tax=viral metagenome TaxID=1070528 RepID=A0A6C0E1A9_9ZZZZ